MSNVHLTDRGISLKAKGLLSVILSLPEDWNYTTRGLAAICKEGVDSIGAALRELESAGYLARHRLRDRSGRISDTEYDPMNADILKLRYVEHKRMPAIAKELHLSRSSIYSRHEIALSELKGILQTQSA